MGFDANSNPTPEQRIAILQATIERQKQSIADLRMLITVLVKRLGGDVMLTDEEIQSTDGHIEMKQPLLRAGLKPYRTLRIVRRPSAVGSVDDAG